MEPIPGAGHEGALRTVSIETAWTIDQVNNGRYDSMRSMEFRFMGDTDIAPEPYEGTSVYDQEAKRRDITLGVGES